MKDKTPGPMECWIAFTFGSVICHAINYVIVGDFDGWAIVESSYWFGVAMLMVHFGLVAKRVP